MKLNSKEISTKVGNAVLVAVLSGLVIKTAEAAAEGIVTLVGKAKTKLIERKTGNKLTEELTTKKQAVSAPPLPPAVEEGAEQEIARSVSEVAA